MSSFLLHIHPAKVHARTLKFGTTLGLGLISLYLFIILAVTGALLMFYYVPATDQAYQSMKDLEFVVTAGQVVRNIHSWAAHLMVVFVALHLCRVFYTAAYKPPREFNWVIGVGLFLLTLGLSFTGYLLPWDQLAYWAITVGTSIAGYAPLIGEKMKFILLGGHTVGQAALIRFYVLHVIVLPAAMALLIAVHLWRVRKDGGLARPDEPRAVAGADARDGAAANQDLRPDGTGARHDAAGRRARPTTSSSPGRTCCSARFCSSCSSSPWCWCWRFSGTRRWRKLPTRCIRRIPPRRPGISSACRNWCRTRPSGAASWCRG